MKDNLIKLGMKENDIPNLEKYLFSKKLTIIFPDTFSKKFDLNYEETKKILFFLVEEKIIFLMYRVKIDSYYWDYDDLSSIPAEIEIDDKVVDNILERTYILFKVINYEK